MTNRDNLNIAYGLGVDYAIFSKSIIDISWLRYNGHGKMERNYQPYADIFMMGIRYRFNM